jgi:hypothetical protein
MAGGATQQGGAGQANYMMNGPGGDPTTPVPGQTQAPQWLKGLQLGQQIAQGAQRPPMQPPQMQRPMLGGPPPGLGQGGVPGAQGMAPPMPGGQPPGMMAGGPAPIMMGGGQGMQMGGGMPPGSTPQINPQILQMLMQRRQ